MGRHGRAHNEEQPFPPDTESHVAQFTELVATAIANAEARAELQRLAAEQAALRRVATLVAEEAPPADVFDAATAEVGGRRARGQVGMSALRGPRVARRRPACRGPTICRVGLRVPLVG